MHSWAVLLRNACAQRETNFPTKTNAFTLVNHKEREVRRCEASGTSGFMELRAPDTGTMTGQVFKRRQRGAPRSLLIALERDSTATFRLAKVLCLKRLTQLNKRMSGKVPPLTRPRASKNHVRDDSLNEALIFLISHIFDLETFVTPLTESILACARMPTLNGHRR